MLTPNNNEPNTAMGQVAASIGNGLAAIASAYTKNRKAQEDAAHQAEMRVDKAFTELMYRHLSAEIFEVFIAASSVIGDIKPTCPMDILLPFDGAKFVDKVDSFHYRVDKVAAKGDTEGVHIRTIQATVNELCRDRYHKGLSNALSPLQCEIDDAIYYFKVSVSDLESEVCDTLPLKCSLGA